MPLLYDERDEPLMLPALVLTRPVELEETRLPVLVLVVPRLVVTDEPREELVLMLPRPVLDDLRLLLPMALPRLEVVVEPRNDDEVLLPLDDDEVLLPRPALDEELPVRMLELEDEPLLDDDA